nr:MMPL family transporter [Flexivirga aerilata]
MCLSVWLSVWLSCSGGTVSKYLANIARWCFRHRKTVVALWILVAAAVIATAQLSGGKTNDNFTIPGTESQQMQDLLAKDLPAAGGAQTRVVFATHGSQKLTSPTNVQAVKETMAQLAKVPGVVAVTDPFSTKQVSPSGQVGLGTIQYKDAAQDVSSSTLDRVNAVSDTARNAGVQVEYAGSVYPGSEFTISEIPEIIGIVVAFIVLLVTFAAFVAAGLPIINAILGVIVTVMSVTALAAVVDIASTSTTVALMLGLSCGIDYGVFILSRHRNNLIAGLDVEDSVYLAVGTAGSSVVFAGLTVIVALCGMAVVGIPFLTVMGLAAAGAVLIALLIALTLLPASLGFAGRKVISFIPSPGMPGHHEAIARQAVEAPEKSAGGVWARFVVRFRVPVLIVGVLGLLVMASPALDMQLGLPSGSSQSKDNTARKAYDLTTEGFGVGFNGPLLVTAQNVDSPADVQQLVGALQKQDNVVTAVPTVSQGKLAIISVIPKTGPNDPKTADLVTHLRDNRSQIEGTTGTKILVGGQTASNIDVSTKLTDALPIFLIVVAALAFVLLTFAFRTILIPIKSIVGFLLSVGAAFGLEVAIFQWGWGASLLGVTKGEIISFLPLIMLAIIFGLSSDYEVFVVSRIKEDYTKTGDGRGAVERGTTSSARVVTAAALIMFSIFVAFMVTDDPTIKAIGFGFAAGVFIDAFVVRLTLVPALMAIVGSKVWYHPQWFARHIPDPDIEGEKLSKEFEDRLHPAEAPQT